MTKAILATMIALSAATAATAGILGDALAPHLPGAISLVITLATGFVVGYFDRRAKAAASKSLAERTLADRAAILADQQLKMLRIEQLTTFGTNWVLANMDRIDPLRAPLEQADELVTDFLEGLERRNAELAASLRLDRKSATERLADRIGDFIAKQQAGLPV